MSCAHTNCGIPEDEHEDGREGHGYEPTLEERIKHLEELVGVGVSAGYHDLTALLDERDALAVRAGRLEAALRTSLMGSEWQRLEAVEEGAALVGLTLHHDEHFDAPGRCHDDDQDCQGCGGHGYDQDLVSDGLWHYPPCERCGGSGLDPRDGNP